MTTQVVTKTKGQLKKELLELLTEDELRKEIEVRKERSRKVEVARKTIYETERLKRQPNCPIVGKAYKGQMAEITVIKIEAGRGGSGGSWAESIKITCAPRVAAYFGGIVDERKHELNSALLAMTKIWLSNQIHQPEALAEFLARSIDETTAQNYNDSRQIKECVEYQEILKAFAVLELVERLTLEELNQVRNNSNAERLVKDALVAIKDPKELARLKKLVKPNPKYDENRFWGW
jgi:hypothetical protein